LIILDENQYAQQLLETKKDYPKLRNLIVLAKYYKSLGDKPKTIKEKLIEYCLQRDKFWNESVQGWKLKIAIRETNKK
jgi:hypothetical protein